MNELIVAENINSVELFSGKQVDDLLAKITKEVKSVHVDISTEQGRKDCASLAYKVAKSKTFLDDMGKELVSEWKEKSKLVDAERKKIRDSLDALKEEVRKPLTDFENEEQNRVKEHETKIAEIFALANFTDANGLSFTPSIQQIKDRVEQLPVLKKRDWQEFSLRAVEVVEQVHVNLRKALEQSEAAEAQKAELEKLRQQQAERERSDREAKIKAEAEAAERVRADREIAAAKAKEEAAVKAAKEAAEKAERDKEVAAKALKDAEDKAIRNAEEAKIKAEKEKEAAVKAEQDRAARVKEEEEAAAAKREANKKHCATINRQALADLVTAGLPETEAKKAIEAIAKGLIKNVSISY